MTLHTETGGTGPRVVVAHGFTQNARCWGRFGRRLATGHEVVAVDLPGHGATPAAHDDADLVEAGRLLVEAGGPGVYVGYSMGGRVALHAALHAAPGDRSPMRGLVLIGVTAGMDEADDRADRRRADEALARRLEVDGLPSFLDRWLANPLFAGLDPADAARAERLTNRVEGLAASLRSCGTGTQSPLWDRLASVEVPVVVIAGDRDAKFTALGHRLVDGLPDARFVPVAGTHAVHLEAPEVVAGIVGDFVADIGLPDRLGDG